MKEITLIEVEKSTDAQPSMCINTLSVKNLIGIRIVTQKIKKRFPNSKEEGCAFLKQDGTFQLFFERSITVSLKYRYLQNRRAHTLLLR